MKTLNKYIQEKYLIDIDSDIEEYKFQPKSFDYLQQLIIEKVKYFDGDLKNDVVDLNDIDTSKIVEMDELFNHWEISSRLYRIDISNWNVKKVISMDGMFAKCKNLISVGDLANWDIRNVIGTSFMFQECYSLEDIGNISNWKFNEMLYMQSMFANCKSLKTIGDISGWKFKNFVNLNSMFYRCDNLKDLGDLNKWDIGKISYDNMFEGCKLLKNIPDWYTK